MHPVGWLVLVVAVVAIVAGAIFLWCRGKGPVNTLDDTSSAIADNEGGKLVNNARAVQEAYWTADPNERERLLAKGEDALDWNEALRLLHLSCLQMLSEGIGKQQLTSGEVEPGDAPEGTLRDLIERLVKRLHSPGSPYRPRPVAVWQGQPGESEKRDPDIQGEFRNASLTHIGCIEVLRVGEDGQPTSLEFVSLDSIRGAVFASPAVYRYAKLFFDNGRPDEVVLVPLLYGVSWKTPNDFDRDGTFTRFVCNLGTQDVPGGHSIGVGHQDFVVDGENATLFGLGSVGEIMVMLAVDDPKFDTKCRARGLDPETIRKSVGDAGDE